jgi:carboxypeptidase family protein
MRIVPIGVLICFVCLALSTGAAAQTHRLRGTVRGESGEPLNGAQIRAEAVTGFRGEPFGGQRVFSQKTNKKGEWSILGLTAGTWVFEARAEGMVPQVMVLPITLSDRTVVSSNPGGLLPWVVPFVLRAATGTLAAIGDASKATPGRSDGVKSALEQALGSSDAAVLIAAGDLALIAGQIGPARTLFDQAAIKRPDNAFAQLGLASVSMLMHDWDAAAKSYWLAREHAPEELKGALGWAIKDLQKITSTRN